MLELQHLQEVHRAVTKAKLPVERMCARIGSEAVDADELAPVRAEVLLHRQHEFTPHALAALRALHHEFQHAARDSVCSRQAFQGILLLALDDARNKADGLTFIFCDKHYSFFVFHTFNEQTDVFVCIECIILGLPLERIERADVSLQYTDEPSEFHVIAVGGWANVHYE